MRSSSGFVGLVGLIAGVSALLGCASSPSRSAPTPTVASVPASEAPEHVVEIAAGWNEVAAENFRAAVVEHRGDPWAGLQWTAAEQAERDEARQTIARASAEDRPWLLVAYVGAFVYQGIGSEWADALLEIPTTHPVWSGEIGLLGALEASSDPPRFRAFVHAIAAAGAGPQIRAESIYLELENADRLHDWARAEDLHAQLASIQIPSGDSFLSGVDLLDFDHMLDPARPLRPGTTIPSFCAPAILGPRAGERVCIDEEFPYAGTTLVVGWASWCGPCNEQLPRVIALLRYRPLRVIAISQDEDAERARSHLHELGVDDWTVLLGGVDRPLPLDPMSLSLRPIPYLALVDGEGEVESGPPWLDAENLAHELVVRFGPLRDEGRDGR